MKTMTCKELGGPCDQSLSADTWEEMVRKMTRHVIREHPNTAKAMEEMHNQDPRRWAREMKPKWEATAQA